MACQVSFPLSIGLLGVLFPLGPTGSAPGEWVLAPSTLKAQACKRSWSRASLKWWTKRCSGQSFNFPAALWNSQASSFAGLPLCFRSLISALPLAPGSVFE